MTGNVSNARGKACTVECLQAQDQSRLELKVKLSKTKKKQNTSKFMSKMGIRITNMANLKSQLVKRDENFKDNIHNVRKILKRKTLSKVIRIL